MGWQRPRQLSVLGCQRAELSFAAQHCWLRALSLWLLLLLLELWLSFGMTAGELSRTTCQELLSGRIPLLPVFACFLERPVPPVTQSHTSGSAGTKAALVLHFMILLIDGMIY